MIRFWLHVTFSVRINNCGRTGRLDNPLHKYLLRHARDSFLHNSHGNNLGLGNREAEKHMIFFIGNPFMFSWVSPAALDISLMAINSAIVNQMGQSIQLSRLLCLEWSKACQRPSTLHSYTAPPRWQQRLCQRLQTLWLLTKRCCLFWTRLVCTVMLNPFSPKVSLIQVWAVTLSIKEASKLPQPWEKGSDSKINET